MTDQAKISLRPWLKILQFSVRGLLFLVLVIGLWLGWLVRGARMQRESVHTILSTGGSVTYTHGYLQGRAAWMTGLLEQSVGIDFFGHVIAIELPVATEALIQKIGHLSHVQALYLGHSSLDDRGLAHLAGLTELTLLDLDGTPVSDAGLAHLSRLTRLEHLALSDTRITDAGPRT